MLTRLTLVIATCFLYLLYLFVWICFSFIGGCVSGYIGLFGQTNNMYGLGVLNSPRGVRYLEDQMMNGLVDREVYTSIGDFLFGEIDGYVNFNGPQRRLVKERYYDEAAKLGSTLRGESNACMSNIPAGYPTFKESWTHACLWVKGSYNQILENLIASLKAGNEQEDVLIQIVSHILCWGFYMDEADMSGFDRSYEGSRQDYMMAEMRAIGNYEGRQEDFVRDLASTLIKRRNPLGHTFLILTYSQPRLGQAPDMAKAVSLALEADRLGLVTEDIYESVLGSAHR